MVLAVAAGVAAGVEVGVGGATGAGVAWCSASQARSTSFFSGSRE
jgi:hypothetical protein